MQTFRLTIAYDGTNYFGWQRQLGRPTVQGAIDAALLEVTGAPPKTLGAGRTDRGVHALGQVVAARLCTQLAPDVLRRACNAKLPRDIVVLDAAVVDASFHPIRNALGKRYRYLICDSPLRDVFRLRYAWQIPTGRLNHAAMAEAAAALLGTHDFRSFASSGSPRKTTVRTVRALTVARSGAGEWPLGGSPCGDDWITIEIEADGFLYNMVRTIVGTLVDVARGARASSWPGKVLAACDRTRAGRTAPPQGLYLLRVAYPAGS